MWERGAKLQFTEPSPVNAKERTVYWGNTLLKQVPALSQLRISPLPRAHALSRPIWSIIMTSFS